MLSMYPRVRCMCGGVLEREKNVCFIDGVEAVVSVSMRVTHCRASHARPDVRDAPISISVAALGLAASGPR